MFFYTEKFLNVPLTNAVYQFQATYDYPEIGEAIRLLKELILQRRK